ncbi:EF-P lysine aminoacylase EpmA [Cysteiniphilum halobium]|uniref:EF-P lysine aminoacylase EpmA n=1 Tax=Cysteiniphilum halobium TaxID=2219059 RepID=UPI000E65DAFE|nr:EF-P lysine aminoacylase EpmA [Cysteiniphilum halobium]
MLPSNSALIRRTEYITKIRKFFAQRGVLEVDTPLSYSYPVSDPYIDAFAIETQSGTRFLQTSPEYAMKRLLAQGSGSIYQICKAFRDDPKAQYHNHEFTMLEWYRVGLDDEALREEIAQMLLVLNPQSSIEYFSYKALFHQFIGINPHAADLITLQKLVYQHVGDIQGLANPNVIECLDLLFTHVIEPKLKAHQFVFVYDYPEVQAALARVMPDSSGQVVAKRFELFYQGVELANGYYELISATEQAKRFQDDIHLRQALGKTLVPIDQDLLACLDQIPECSGVALGLDRLIMCLEEYADIHEVLYC